MSSRNIYQADKKTKPPKIYKYINRKNNYQQYDPNEILSESYSLSEIKTKFVVGEENNGYFQYLVFDNIRHYQAYAESIPENRRNFHEIIFGLLPQKLKIDIDVKSEAINSDSAELLPEEIPLLLQNVDETVKIVMKLLYKIEINDSDIITTDSSGQDGETHKYSFHKIINNYYVSNCDESAYFTNILMNFMDRKFAKYIDNQVNKKIQNFRITGCCKYGSSRYKRLINENIPFDHTIIGCVYYCKKLQDNITISNPNIGIVDICDDSDRENAGETELCDIPEEDIREILKISQNHTTGFTYRCTIGNGENKLICFDRLNPSYCDICNDTHHRDNTLMITARFKDGICYLNKKCRHSQSGKIFIGSFPVYAGTDGKKSEVSYSDHMDKIFQRYIDDDREFDSGKMFRSLPENQKNIYVEENIREFEHCDTLCVKANTGMGKTRKLVEYIGKHFRDSPGKTNRIVFISFRQTFSSNIKDKFPDFCVYSDVTGDLTQNKLIVQVESLHRIRIGPRTPDIDLLILDESESILSQFSSGLGRYFMRSWPAFQFLINNAKHVICMDANLSDRTFDTLDRMRIKKENKYGQIRNIFFHCNEYKNREKDLFYISSNKINWYAKLYDDIEAGYRVVIPTNSLSEAKTLEKNIKTRFPGISIGIYTGETANSVKKEHFNNVRDYWSEYDVLLYTPTITAGVSYEEIHYDKLYALFNDESCEVRAAIQMLHRVRDIAEHEYNICLDVRGGNMPTDINKIKQILYNNRENLFKDYDVSLLNFTYNNDGTIKYYESDYFSLWLENTKYKNMSKNSFARLMISYLKETGASIEISDYRCNNPEIIRQENNTAKTEIKHEKYAKLSQASDMDIEDIHEIQEKFIDQTSDITEEEKYNYERYKLRRHYNWDGPIDNDFAAKYSDRNVMNVFRNIKKILAKSDIYESLRDIQREEMEHYRRTMESGLQYQDADVNREYVYDKHRVCIALLRLCGWSTITDGKYICESELSGTLQQNCDKIYDTVEKYYHYYKDRNIKYPNKNMFKYNDECSDRTFLSNILPYINKFTNYMYGVKIINTKGFTDIYRLSEITIFNISPADLDKTKPSVFAPEWNPNARIENTNTNIGEFEISDETRRDETSIAETDKLLDRLFQRG